MIKLLVDKYKSIPYIILLVVFVLLIILSNCFYKDLTTEIVWTMISVFIIDFLISYENIKREIKIRKIVKSKILIIRKSISDFINEIIWEIDYDIYSDIDDTVNKIITNMKLKNWQEKNNHLPIMKYNNYIFKTISNIDTLWKNLKDVYFEYIEVEYLENNNNIFEWNNNISSIWYLYLSLIKKDFLIKWTKLNLDDKYDDNIYGLISKSFKEIIPLNS